MILQQWSIPLRHNGAKSLTPLPTETYLEIFTYARTLPFPKALLKTLSLTCRLFYIITIPWIFEEVTITSQRLGIDPSRSISSLSREVRKGDRNALEIAKYITRCNFTHWLENNNPKLEWCIPGLISLHSNALGSMSNLRELSLTSTVITKSLLKATTGLLRLDSLKLNECCLKDDVLPKHLSLLSFLKLKVLHYQPYRFLHHDNANSLPLETIFDHLHLGSLVEIKSSNDDPLSRLVHLEGNLPLRKVIFRRVVTCKDLVKLLVKTPALELLHVSSVDNVQCSDIKSCLAPQLKSLKLPALGLDSLIGGHGIQEVLFTDPTSLEQFKRLHPSSRSYTSMRVPAEVYLEVPFWKQFIKLTTLKITFHRYSAKRWRALPTTQNRTEIETVVSKWPKHPPMLRSLYLNLVIPNAACGSPTYLLQQHFWIIDIIFPKIPTLRQCRFDDYFTWFYIEDDAKWKAEINSGKEQDILDHLSILPNETNRFIERMLKF